MESKSETKKESINKQANQRLSEPDLWMEYKRDTGLSVPLTMTLYMTMEINIKDEDTRRYISWLTNKHLELLNAK